MVPSGVILEFSKLQGGFTYFSVSTCQLPTPLAHFSRSTKIMGRWGIENLECDGAQDALANYCDDLFSKIVELLKHPRVHEYDDEPIDELFVNLEVVFALDDRGMISTSPSADEVEPLLSAFLQKWEEYSGPSSERRQIIEGTSQRLLSIISGSAPDGLSHRLGLIADKMGQQEDEFDSTTKVRKLSEEELRKADEKMRDIMGG